MCMRTRRNNALPCRILHKDQDADNGQKRPCGPRKCHRRDEDGALQAFGAVSYSRPEILQTLE